MAQKSRSFESVARADARVLILGSLPGTMSLERGQYYAQPHNAFWRIMLEVLGLSPGLPYKARLRALKENHIALWDVCGAGCRMGSLDSAIQLATVEANDISGFLQAHPSVHLICFNGRKAKEIYDRKVRQDPRTLFERVRHEVLPSTSPAHAAMPFERKLALWQRALCLESGRHDLRTGARCLGTEAASRIRPKRRTIAKDFQLEEDRSWIASPSPALAELRRFA